MDTYEDAVRREVAEAADVEAAEVGLDDTFESLGVDSLDALGMISNLEDEFGVDVPDEDLKGLETVRNAVDVLRPAAGA